MIINGEIKVKDTIDTKDIANIVEDAVSFVIFRRNNGTIAYMPYYIENAIDVALLANIIENIEIEDDDPVIDNQLRINDKAVTDAIYSFIVDNEDTISEIKHHVHDIVEFRKQLYANQNDTLSPHLVKALEKESILNDLLFEIAKKQSKALTQEINANEKQEEILSKMSEEDIINLQKKFASGDFDVKQMVDEVVSMYVSSDKSRDQKYKEIIEEKNNKIMELSKYKAMIDARNVLSDDGK